MGACGGSVAQPQPLPQAGQSRAVEQRAPVLLGHKSPEPPLHAEKKQPSSAPEQNASQAPTQAAPAEEGDDEVFDPFSEPNHIGWVAQARQESAVAAEKSEHFHGLLADVKVGAHTLALRFDLAVLLVPGFFSQMHRTYMRRTQMHISTLGLTCRMANLNTAGSVAQNAALLAEQIIELSVLTRKRVVLVGHSRGGCDAVAAVARHRERLHDRVAGVLCLQAPLGGTPLAGDYTAGRVQRTLRYMLGGEVDALAEVTYMKRMEELKAFPYPAEVAPVLTFASKTERSSGALEPLASHMRRKYGVETDGLVSLDDAHLPDSMAVTLDSDWDHAACAYRIDGEGEKEELVVEALMTLLSQEIPLMGPRGDPALAPVCAFWNEDVGEHTLHPGEARRGERKNGVAFYAYKRQVEGTEAVHRFWNNKFHTHNYHMAPARTDEEGAGVQFYAFGSPQEGTEPLYSFWNEDHCNFTAHMGNPMRGETKKGVICHVFRNPGPLDLEGDNTAVAKL